MCFSLQLWGRYVGTTSFCICQKQACVQKLDKQVVCQIRWHVCELCKSTWLQMFPILLYCTPGLNGKNVCHSHLDNLSTFMNTSVLKGPWNVLLEYIFLKVDSSESARCLQCQSRRRGQRAGFCQRSCLSGRHSSPSSLRFSPRWEWHLNSCCINNVWEKRRRRSFCQSRHLTLTHLVGLCPFNSTGLLEPSGVHRRDDRKLLTETNVAFLKKEQKKQTDYLELQPVNYHS